MRNIKRPDAKPDRMRSQHPLQPNVYTGPYGTAPKDHAPAPFWYKKKRPEDPMRARALSEAFRQSAQKRTNRQRHPSDSMRGF